MKNSLSLLFIVLALTPLVGQHLNADHNKSLGLLHRSLAELQQVADGLTDAQARFKPTENQWSIKNNVDHLVKVEDLVWDILDRALRGDGDGKQADITDEALIARLTDRGRTFNAPDVLKPADDRYAHLSDAMNDFMERRERTIHFVRSTDANLRQHFAMNPVFGNMDALQWTLHLSAHCLRHIEQIKEIIAHDRFPKS